MRTFRSLLAFALVLTMLLTFCGCGKQGGLADAANQTTAPSTDTNTDPTKPDNTDKEDGKEDEEEDEKDDEKENEKENEKEDENTKPTSGIDYQDLYGLWVTELDIVELVKDDLIAGAPEDKKEIEGVFKLIDKDDLTIDWYWEFGYLGNDCTMVYDEETFNAAVELFAERYCEAYYEYHKDEIDATYEEFCEANFEDLLSDIEHYFFDWPMCIEIVFFMCEDGEVFFEVSEDEWVPANISIKGTTMTVESMDSDLIYISDTLCEVMFPLKLTRE